MSVERGGREVLRLDSFVVRPGEVVALIGPNGAGKTTLLLAAALLLPVHGDVRMFGEDVRRGNAVALRRRTATVFQDAALLDMSARRNVETALALKGVPAGERRERAEEWLHRLGIAHRADARAHQLSGGEAQRVSLARAFAAEPRLLFLDEPFASVDQPTHGALIGDLRGLLASEDTAAILATHDRAEARLLADRALLLIDGAVAQDGPIDDVVRQPANSEAARFLGYSVVPAAVAAQLGGMEANSHRTAAIPPSAVRIVDHGAPVSVVAIRGARKGVEIIVDAGAPVALRMSVSELHTLGIDVGDKVAVTVDPAGITWL